MYLFFVFLCVYNIQGTFVDGYTITRGGEFVGLNLQLRGNGFGHVYSVREMREYVPFYKLISAHSEINTENGSRFEDMFKNVKNAISNKNVWY
ncbi:hypothetical protein CWI39_0149p0010 [Hamiltosporidium magnivora]|uniref:Uncharacterized protein n=1 Tax=Hamiltosporidium magnivora TaxID=148818 RepID=A0A4Q9LLA4_9MICR|nr:hypothetical protein CWI39_0149p0010 [Hamiltosporidium magnivora]